MLNFMGSSVEPDLYQLNESVANAAEVLKEVSSLDAEDQLAQMILSMYRLILDGASLADLRKAADRLYAKNLKNAI